MEGFPILWSYDPSLAGVALFAVCSLASVGVSQGGTGWGKRPNIVFIFADDHASRAIGAYGSKINRTPNIDRLADEGMRFENCFVTNAICGPSRACILTGQYSHKNGFFRNGNRFDGGQMTFPKILRKNGYATAMIGKWHLSSDPTGFDYWEILRGQGTYYNPNMLSDTGPKKHTGYTTDIITDLALNWLKIGRDKDKPFVLMFQHKAPHRNWQPGPKHLTMYDDVTIPEPATLFDDYKGRASPASKQQMMIGKNLTKNDLKFTRPRNLTPAQLEAWNAAYGPKNAAFEKAGLEGKALVEWKYQRYIKDYLRCVASVDDNVGRLLKYLDDTGLAKNTVVIYSSDQGWYLGEHGWFDKRWMYEESLKMPFLIRWPGVVEPGSVQEGMISNVDFAETFLDIAGCGAQTPKDMQGRSIVPLLKGQMPADWRKSFYYHYYEFPGAHSVAKHFGVRTDRYKLIHYYRAGEWELFDLQSDPNELHSVYDDPAYTDVVMKLKVELERLQTEFDDKEPQKPVPGDPELRRNRPHRGRSGRRLATGPLQVFILAGQSNMQGKGLPAHVDTMLADPAMRAKFRRLKNGDKWVVRDDVWITYKRGGRGKGKALNPKGGLSIGYGSTPKQFGPELGFGYTIGEHVKEQVLLIKCAWGGVAVRHGFLPPGAGGPGEKYTEMITDIKAALANLKASFPRYRQRRGYELAGLVWFQGWNDAVGAGNPKYTEQLAQLIRDVRKDLGAPNLPVVIGELGQAGGEPSPRTVTFRAQQEAVADLEEFRGSVRLVQTHQFIDPRLPQLFALWRKCDGAARKAKKQGLGDAAVATAWAPWKQREAEWNRIAGGRPYHYYGSGRTFLLMGDAFARAMIDLTEK